MVSTVSVCPVCMIHAVPVHGTCSTPVGGMASSVRQVWGVVQEQLDTFVYKALGQTVSSIAKGASKSNWFPETALSDSVSSYMEQLVTMLQVRVPPTPPTPTLPSPHGLTRIL